MCCVARRLRREHSVRRVVIKVADTLIQFGGGHGATVRSSGVVDIRLVDDPTQRTLTGRMSVDELMWVALQVVGNIKSSAACTSEERESAQMIYDVMWGELLS